MLNNLRNTSLWEFEVHVLLLILQTRFSPRSFYRVSDYDEISEGSILCTILYPQERGRANSLVSNYSVMSFKYFLFHFFSQRPLRCGLIFRRDNSTSSIHLISIHRAPLNVCIHLILNGFRGPSPPMSPVEQDTFVLYNQRTVPQKLGYKNQNKEKIYLKLSNCFRKIIFDLPKHNFLSIQSQNHVKLRMNTQLNVKFD